MSEDFFRIVDKIKRIKDLDSAAKVAKALGMSRNNLYSYRRRGSLPLKALRAFCVRENILFDDLMNGIGQGETKAPPTTDAEYWKNKYITCMTDS